MRPWGPPVMVVTTMWQAPGVAVPPLAGLPGDAKMPLNLPSTASAYFWGPCVANVWNAFTCALHCTRQGKMLGLWTPCTG